MESDVAKREKDRKRKHEEYEFFKARKLCVQCHKRRAAEGRVCCVGCLEINRRRNAANYRARRAAGKGGDTG